MSGLVVDGTAYRLRHWVDGEDRERIHLFESFEKAVDVDVCWIQIYKSPPWGILLKRH